MWYARLSVKQEDQIRLLAPLLNPLVKVRALLDLFVLILGLWCNGSTSDFTGSFNSRTAGSEPANDGANPSPVALKTPADKSAGVFVYTFNIWFCVVICNNILCIFCYVV